MKENERIAGRIASVCSHSRGEEGGEERRKRERRKMEREYKGKGRAEGRGEAARSETKLVAFRGTRAVWKRRRERDKRGSRG